jgi:hypothetical protein
MVPAHRKCVEMLAGGWEAGEVKRREWQRAQVSASSKVGAAGRPREKQKRARDRDMQTP